MITGFVRGQQLTMRSPVIAADTIDYLMALFTFQTREWAGLEKWSHWQNGAVVYDIPLENDQIPESAHLNLAAGTWYVWLHGNLFEDGEVVRRITTEKAQVTVVPTGSLNGEPFPEIPASETERILARLTALEKTEGGGGTVDTENFVRFVESQTLRVGENVLTDDMVTLGAGWSGSLADGFTHTSGSTEPLTFAVGAADGESYLVEGNYTDYTGERKLLLALGDSYETDPYEGYGVIKWGLTCVGDDGALKLIPSSSYTGTVTNLMCRKISDDGTEDVEVEMRQIQHTDLPDHLTGFWNIALGFDALGSSVNSTRNIAIGCSSLPKLVTGGRNIGLGTYSMSQMETGESNVGIGADAMFRVRQAEECIAIGKGAMTYGKSLKKNIAIGGAALYGDTDTDDTESEDNVAIGYAAGYKCAGKSNVFIGRNAGYYNAAGVNNVFIGTNAGRNSTAYNQIAIGQDANNGRFDNSIAIGKGATNTKYNQVVIGADNAAETVLHGDVKIRKDGVEYTAATTEPMTGATADADGAAGLVPPPAAGDVEKYLAGDGTWKTLPDGGSGGTSDAVQYVTQTLTEEQQMQARKNLGLYRTEIRYPEIWSEPATWVVWTADTEEYLQLPEDAAFSGEVNVKMTGNLPVSGALFVDTIVESQSYEHKFSGYSAKWYGNGDLISGILKTVHSSDSYTENMYPDLPFCLYKYYTEMESGWRFTYDKNRIEAIEHVGYNIFVYDPNNPFTIYHTLDENFIPALDKIILNSSDGSGKKFRVTVDDTGALSATEITE